MSKVSKILGNRAFRIVFSLAAAIALWIYVEYFVNEDINSRPIKVAVEFINSENVTDKKLIVTELQTEFITFEFSGKRTNIGKLYESGAIRVTANLADVTSPGLSMLEYKLIFASGIDQNSLTQISSSDAYVYVNVESMYEKEVQITAKIESEALVAEGYQSEYPVFAPETVTVYGPKSEVDNVSSVRVSIQRENLTKTVVADMAFVPVDAEGNEIESTLLTFDRETVSMTIRVLQLKEVALDVSFKYGAGATVENTVYTIEPKTITVSGDPESMDFNSILLMTADLTQFDSYYTATVPIILPNGITNVTGVTEAEITISVKGLETKRLTVPEQNFQITNEWPGYSATLYTTSLDVTIRGTEDELENITADNIRVVVDLYEFGETTGVTTLAARVRLDGVTGDCGVIGEYKATVRVLKDSATAYSIGG